MDLRTGLGRPARRLRVKTSLGKKRLQFKLRIVGKQSILVAKQFALAEVGAAQDPWAELEDWAAQEKPGGRRAVYLVTLPHPKRSHTQCGKKLVAPGTLTKKQILKCLLDAAAHPTYTDAPGTQPALRAFSCLVGS